MPKKNERRSAAAFCHDEGYRLLISAVRYLVVLALVGSIFSTGVQAQGPSEYQVKAAFLYNFAKFVDWPSEAFNGGNAPLVIGVIGNDPFGGALDQAINGKNIGGRQLTVRRLRWGQDLRSCHILFISSSERQRLPQILQSVSGTSVLTVADMGGFTQQGGMINFILVANKVRFEINARVAEQVRLKISSKLMVLGKTR